MPDRISHGASKARLLPGFDSHLAAAVSVLPLAAILSDLSSNLLAGQPGLTVPLESLVLYALAGLLLWLPLRRRRHR